MQYPHCSVKIDIEMVFDFFDTGRLYRSNEALSRTMNDRIQLTGGIANAPHCAHHRGFVCYINYQVSPHLMIKVTPAAPIDLPSSVGKTLANGSPYAAGISRDESYLAQFQLALTNNSGD